MEQKEKETLQQTANRQSYADTHCKIIGNRKFNIIILNHQL